MTYTHSPNRLAVLAVLAILVLVASAGGAGAQTPTVNRNDVLYILPLSAIGTDAAAIADLRARLAPNGDGPYVKVGFSQYVFLAMEDWNVNPSDPAAVRAKIAGSIANINGIVANARANGFPVALAILDAVKETYDPVQRASEAEDIRSMHWYADNALAPGYWSFSRYARKRALIQQAYMREVAKEIAKLMRDFPDTLVAASGDGEVELARPRPAPADLIYADYSPFTVAEFRDWIRLGGLYAAGAEFAGQGYTLGARYAGDRTPGEDTNGDGHTLNGDFGTNFSLWNLLHFDWNLADRYMSSDPGAISLATYSAAGFNKTPAEIPGGFDPPRTPRTMGTNAWWDTWVLFKQTMIQRYNVEFAKWMTTSPAPPAADAAVEADSGYTIPRERWYSYQIPADYMFQCPVHCASPNERWYSSMSSWWTADISPYGSLGITAFNVDWIDPGLRLIARTLSYVAPRIAERDVRWGIIEWHPGVLKLDTGVSADLELFRSEMAIVEKYRPNLLMPFMWGLPNSEVRGTAFETALREMIGRIKDGRPPRLVIDTPANGAVKRQPLSLTGWAADFNKSPGGGPGIDQVDVYANPASGASPIFLGSATYGLARADVASTYGSQFSNSGFSLTIEGLPLGTYEIEARGRSTVSQSFDVTARVSVGLVNFAGPADGGGWSGTISGSNLIYNGATYPIVNGRVNFPDCTTYIVAGNGSLMGGAATPNCAPGGGGGGGGLVTPTIAWATPSSVTVGTPLSATQLNASSGGVAGTFAYTPTLGTAMNTAGSQTLSVTFTPADGATYASAAGSVTLVVTASSGGGDGNFVGPANGGGWSGTISGGNLLYRGGTYPIVNGRVNFPDCTTFIVAPNGALMGGGPTPNCTPGGGGGLITPTIAWATPGAVTVGTPLSATQLNASSGGVAGNFAYTPSLGMAMNTAGSQTLSVTLTPADLSAYTTATASVTLVVTASGGGGGGSFVGPANGGGWSGTISGGNLLYRGGTYQIVNGRVNFPDCTTFIVAPNGALMGGSATPNCTPSGGGGGGGLITPTIAWATPAAVAVGTTLSATQLNASSGGVAGTFAYTPSLGMAMNTAGSQTLSVTFAPADLSAYTTATASVTLVVTASGGGDGGSFVGPAAGGGWSGTISGENLLYRGGTYPIVNGRVGFPDCTTFIVGPNGALMGGSATPNCTPGGGGGGGGLITPTITWATPNSVTVGTTLSVTQLNATSGGVSGDFGYTPALGTVMNTAGSQTLSVTFTPTDLASYTTTTKTVQLQVNGAGGAFIGPAAGGGWSGTISGEHLLYRGGTYPIVNGRVSFPDCTMFIVGPNGALMGGSAIPNCTPGGGA